MCPSFAGSAARACPTTAACCAALPQTLARMMREEMKKSIYLCINIVSVFFAISNFSQFHQTIMENQVRAGRAAGVPK